MTTRFARRRAHSLASRRLSQSHAARGVDTWHRDEHGDATCSRRADVALARCLVVVGCAVLVAGWPAVAGAQETTTGRTTPAAAGAKTSDDHAGQGAPQPQTPIPPITDADRAAAFPDVEGHTLSDNAVYSFVLFDHLEWQGVETAGGLSWDTKGWVGRDRDRLWFRTEYLTEHGRLGDAEAHLFYGRAFARSWDVVVGLRQDFRPGPAQSWLAIGVQGLAPYWFDVEATAYLGAGGQTAARLEVEYELLLTNRLVLQPLVKVDLYGKTNADRGIGAGVSSFDAGLRIRYELRREFAPYLGVTWHSRFGETAEFAEAAGDSTGGRQFVAGLRFWF